MLYDNAQLAMIYLRAAKLFNKPAYRDIAIETLDFMLAEMRIDGAFVTSISALDEQGREGDLICGTRHSLKQFLIMMSKLCLPEFGNGCRCRI